MARGRPKKYANAEEAAAANSRRIVKKEEEEDHKPLDALQFIHFQPTFREGAPTSVPAAAVALMPARQPQAPLLQHNDDSKKKAVKGLREALGSLHLQGQLSKEDEAAATILQELQHDKEATQDELPQSTQSTRRASAASKSSSQQPSRRTRSASATSNSSSQQPSRSTQSASATATTIAAIIPDAIEEEWSQQEDDNWEPLLGDYNDEDNYEQDRSSGEDSIWQSSPGSPGSSYGNKHNHKGRNKNKKIYNEERLPTQGAGSGAGTQSRGHVRAHPVPSGQWGPQAQDGEDEPPLAVQIARQLLEFQGCTREQHQAQEEDHTQGHAQANPAENQCSSLPQITTLLSGANCDGSPSTTYVPDVLSQHRLLEREDLEVEGINWPAMFEGNPQGSASASTCTTPIATQGQPWGLCLDKHHSRSYAQEVPETTFDVDSVCAFPTSLAVARQGLNWYPIQYQPLNLKGSVHLGLQAPALDSKGRLVFEWQPLHEIRHLCFGGLIGMSGQLLYFVFPQYNYVRGTSAGAHSTTNPNSTLIRQKDEDMLINEIVLPAIHEAVQLSSILQYYPASAAAARADSLASSSERYVRVINSRQKFITYVIGPEYLDKLWHGILTRIRKSHRFACFRQLTLFLNQKNCKLNYLKPTLTRSLQQWREHWAITTNNDFLVSKDVYVDVGKQVTSPTAQLPSQGKEPSNSETFLYRRCCLESFLKRWQTVVASASASASARASGKTSNPARKDSLTYQAYTWATLRDASSQTVATNRQSQAYHDGYVYGQFYNVVKAPFDAAKIYVFGNDGLENIALDPAYVKGLHKAGGATAFSQEASLKSYLHSKTRAHENIASGMHKSYGIREEHRLSLTLVDEILMWLEAWGGALGLETKPAPAPAPIPYYIIPSVDLFQFLRAQMNKHCLLFEYVLSGTRETHSLPEFIVMVLALRALRHSYGSAPIEQEPMLYKDWWRRMGDGKPATLGGIGMAETMKAYGIGWFLPKMNWVTLRVAQPHADQLLAGNMLHHAQYQRRWRTVRDLRDVYVRLGQVEEWFTRYKIGSGGGAGTWWDEDDNESSGSENDMTAGGSSCSVSSRRKQRAWLDFLHGLNLNQFRHDIASALRRSHQARPELAGDDSIPHPGPLLPRGDGAACVTGNKGRFQTASALINFLLDSDDGEARKGWANLAYRMIYQKTREAVEEHLGKQWRWRWQTEYKLLVQLTHWVLPHANENTFLNPTKSNRSKGLTSRTSWFSTIYKEPRHHQDTIAAWPADAPRSLGEIIWQGHQVRTQPQAGRAPAPEPTPDIPSWDITQLFRAVKGQGLYATNMDRDFVLGRAYHGYALVTEWELGTPPRLTICERIQDQTLEELEEIFARTIREA
ncbi:hypothetical protein VE04_09284 [Pseudogymnoascus sp. 24MN13]|nr:hypothetical protein VE04_09284 [Pseudogymnoascus sp. 24MN13]